MEKYAKYIPLALFCLAVGKLLIFPATWEGAAGTLVVGLLAGAYEFKNQDKKIKELEDKLETVTLVVNNHGKAIENAQSGVSALRLATQMRQQTTPSTPAQRVF